MQNILIVSHIEKSVSFFREILSSFCIEKITSVLSSSEARQIIMIEDFDIVIINSPLKDESGESLAKHISLKSMSMVVLVIDHQYFDDVSMSIEEYGILTVSKPISRNVFLSTLRLANASNNRLKIIKNENDKLKQKIEDIRIVDRAKCVLISRLNISEEEAHRYIEKEAMDTRKSRRVIAESILKKYEYL